MDAGALTEATNVVVVAGASYDARHRKSNIVLGSTGDLETVRALGHQLLNRRSKGMAWTQWPALTVAFLQGRELLAEFPLLDGAAWVHDPVDLYCELADPRAVRATLATMGVVTHPK